jgi:hypothetical protein
LKEPNEEGRVMKNLVKHFQFVIFITILGAFLFLGCSGKGGRQGGGESGGLFEDVGMWTQGQSRIYTVYVSDLKWEEMEEYGRGKPYKNGKTTSVFFFNKWEGTPDVTRYEGSHGDVIDRIYADGDTTYWVARYDRWPSGEEIFMRYPAK